MVKECAWNAVANPRKWEAHTIAAPCLASRRLGPINYQPSTLNFAGLPLLRFFVVFCGFLLSIFFSLRNLELFVFPDPLELIGTIWSCLELFGVVFFIL